MEHVAANTTTEQGFSNINLCYYSSINVLLGDLVTHIVSVPICDVTIAFSIGTKLMCSFRSQKVLLHCDTISDLVEHF